MTNRGLLMLPLALKRNHISGSHTTATADVDRTLEAAKKSSDRDAQRRSRIRRRSNTAHRLLKQLASRLGRPALVPQVGRLVLSGSRT